MSIDNITETIKSPNTLVLSGYSKCISFNHIVTPNLKKTNSCLLYINLNNEYDLGGTIFEDIYDKNIKLINKNISKMCDLYSLGKLKTLFILLQKYIKHNKILAGHDISDGGLITTLIEMSISSNIGLNIDYYNQKHESIDFFFNENPGVVIEVNRRNINYIINISSINFYNSSWIFIKEKINRFMFLIIIRPDSFAGRHSFKFRTRIFWVCICLRSRYE
jgi:phosphoribosylformylglycinamidine synthase